MRCVVAQMMSPRNDKRSHGRGEHVWEIQSRLRAVRVDSSEYGENTTKGTNRSGEGRIKGRVEVQKARQTKYSEVIRTNSKKPR